MEIKQAGGGGVMQEEKEKRKRKMEPLIHADLLFLNKPHRIKEIFAGNTYLSKSTKSLCNVIMVLQASPNGQRDTGLYPRTALHSHCVLEQQFSILCLQIHAGWA